MQRADTGRAGVGGDRAPVLPISVSPRQGVGPQPHCPPSSSAPGRLYLFPKELPSSLPSPPSNSIDGYEPFTHQGHKLGRPGEGRWDHRACSLPRVQELRLGSPMVTSPKSTSFSISFSRKYSVNGLKSSDCFHCLVEGGGSKPGRGRGREEGVVR